MMRKNVVNLHFRGKWVAAQWKHYFEYTGSIEDQINFREIILGRTVNTRKNSMWPKTLFTYNLVEIT